MGLLKNMIILVTGAAGGIGRASAMLFAQEGASVVVSDISPEGCRETEAMISAQGHRAVTIVGDISKSQDAQAMVDTAVKTFGRLDGAFNNAALNGTQAGASGKRVGDWPEEIFDRVVEVNLKGTWLCMRSQLQQMETQGFGTIVNVASLAGLSGYKTTAAYSASKHGIIGLTKTAALEYAPHIRVNCVCPGWVNTEMIAHAVKRMGTEILGGIPMGRLAEATEIAELACWLLSDRSSYVTGVAYAADGGVMAG